MRLHYFLVLGSAVNGDLTGSEACRFIGLSLAKTLSTCDEEIGMCTGIRRLFSSGTLIAESIAWSPVTTGGVMCDEAVSIAREVVDSYALSHASVDLSDLPENIVQILSPGFQGLLWGFLPLDALTISTMVETWDIIMAQLKRELSGETLALISRHIGQDLIADMSNWFSHFNRVIRSSPHSLDTATGLFSGALNFLLDLAAVLPGMQVPDEHTKDRVAFQCMLHHSSHRDTFTMEARVDASGFSTHEALHMMDAIDVIGKLSFSFIQASPVNIFDITNADIDMLDWMLIQFDGSASAAMLEYLVQTRICSVLLGTAELIRNARHL